MSVITKDLGVATAYGYAKSKGYTGTEEEFAELMASYADVAQQAEAAAQDAEDAKDAAITAKTAAQTAQTAAESAQTAAAGSAQTASTKASEASNSAQTAAGSATAAQTSATAASGSAQTAQTAAQTATTKASEASSSASAASTAKTGAETARTGAQTAQTAAETAQANAEAAASSVSASAAQIEQNTEEIGAIKNDLTNGTFPVGNAENADQLTSTVGIEDKTPYLFRTSGGSVDIGDREDVRKIVGGTIVNNQLFNFPQQNTSSGVTLTFENGVVTLSGTATYGYCSFFTARITGGHKILVDTKVVNNPDNLTITFGSLNGQGRATIGSSSITNANNLAYASGIGIEGYGGTGTVFNNVKFQCVCTDLTLMLGTAIADYVYGLEQATAGAGVAWLKKHFPKQFDAGYQAYDAGSLQSVSGLTEHRMVGFNLFNSEAGTVRIIGGMQYQITGTYTALSLDGTAITPDSNGKFTPTNNGTLTVTGGNATDTCVHFVWDGEKDGTYEPYKTWSYALDDSVVIRGIPKVDASGNLYYDGDEYLPDGTVNRRYGFVDMSTLTWRYNETYTVFWADVPGVLPSVSPGKDNARCSKYAVVVTNEYGARDLPDKSMMVNSSFAAVSMYAVVVKDSAYTDVETFKTAMSGVYLVYEKNTPTTETALPYQATQIVDDWGTEEFVLADGAFPVPVGHDTMYQNNLRAKLEMSPESPDGDGLYVVQQESGENTYVPLSSTATIQDILTRLTALENA